MSSRARTRGKPRGAKPKRSIKKRPNAANRSFDSAPQNGSLFVKGTRTILRPGTAKAITYDHTAALEKLSYLAPLPSGEIAQFQEMTPKEIAECIEMVTPLVPIYGCGPRTWTGYLVLRSYVRILEVRNETRCNELGIGLGDRSFKRCYQQAQRDRARNLLAPDALQTEADKAHYAGVRVIFEGAESREGRKYPRLRKATAGERPDGILRSPRYAAQKAFEYLNDKHWHRYLFPFGCFFFEKPPENHQAWKDWKTGLMKGRNEDYYISPYSVTAADLRYLLSTQGYLERYMFNLSIIYNMKTIFNFNVLHCFRLPGCVPGDHQFRRFITLERYFHVFGSLYMHLNAAKDTHFEGGGNWPEVIERLETMATTVCTEFGVDMVTIGSELQKAIVYEVRTTQALTHVFPKCHVVTEADTATATA